LNGEELDPYDDVDQFHDQFNDSQQFDYEDAWVASTMSGKKSFPKNNYTNDDSNSSNLAQDPNQNLRIYSERSALLGDQNWQ
jgi:hypothetical protein